MKINIKMLNLRKQHGFTLVGPPVVRKGFTLVELLVVIAIISLLISILMPSLHKAKVLANRVVCMSNLKQIGSAIHMYAQDWDDNLPYADYGATSTTMAFDLREGGMAGNPWTCLGLLHEDYLQSPHIYYCPVAKDNPFAATYEKNWDRSGSYDYWGNSVGNFPPDEDKRNSLKCTPAAKLSVAWDSGIWNPPWTAHLVGGNNLYLDGHVLWIDVEDVSHAWDIWWFDDQG